MNLFPLSTTVWWKPLGYAELVRILWEKEISNWKTKWIEVLNLAASSYNKLIKALYQLPMQRTHKKLVKTRSHTLSA